jgi:hypothetical protein
VIEHAVTVNQIECTKRFGAELLPSNLLELDASVVYGFEKNSLMMEAEGFTADHILGSAEGKHKRVVAGVAADIEHALISETLRYLRTQADPSLVAAPGAADDNIPAEVERSLEPGVQLGRSVDECSPALRRKGPLESLTETDDGVWADGCRFGTFNAQLLLDSVAN